MFSFYVYRMVSKQPKTYSTKDGKKFRLKVVYEIVAVKVPGVKRGTILQKGKYTNKRAALKRARVFLSAPSPNKKTNRQKEVEKAYKKAYGHGLIRSDTLSHVRMLHTTRKMRYKGEIGGLFIFTYQQNGKRILYERPIEAYSSTTRVPITSLSDGQIQAYLDQALSFARIRFLQDLGLETIDIVLEEFIPPIRYKYYIPKTR